MIVKRKLSAEAQAAIDTLFKDLPDDYVELKDQLELVHHEVRSRIARIFEPKINEFLQSQKPTSHAEHRDVAAEVDVTLQDLGVCVRVKNHPALLAAERDGRSQRQGRYAILERTEYEMRPPKKSFREVVTGEKVPHLNLMAAPTGTDFLLDPIRDHAYKTGRGR